MRIQEGIAQFVYFPVAALHRIGFWVVVSALLAWAAFISLRLFFHVGRAVGWRQAWALSKQAAVQVKKKNMRRKEIFSAWKRK